MELCRILVVSLLFVQSLIQGQKIYIADKDGIKGLSNNWPIDNHASDHVGSTLVKLQQEMIHFSLYA